MSDAFQIKPNTGSLFRNENKQTDKHPDYTGKLDVEGKLYALSAWLNESKTGKKYLSVKVSDPDAFKRDAQPAPAQPKKATEDIPF